MALSVALKPGFYHVNDQGAAVPIEAAKVLAAEVGNVTPEDLRLLRVIRAVGWGEVVVRVKAGKPVSIERAVQAVSLQEKD